MASSSDIVTLALSLPQAERAALAHQLLLSLEPAPFDSEVEELWRAEIEARLAALDAGECELIDWEDAAARIRKALDESKSRCICASWLKRKRRRYTRRFGMKPNRT